jgi:hypothetical protein
MLFWVLELFGWLIFLVGPGVAWMLLKTSFEVDLLARFMVTTAGLATP